MAQILATAIFLVMFLLIITEKLERHVITLLSGFFTLVLVFGIAMRSPEAIWQALNFGEIFSLEFWYHTGTASESSKGINWATIIFIAGMMIMVEGMGHAGVFRWLCMRLAKAVHYRTVPLFFVFMIMSAFLSMFIDSITVILFLAAVTVELAQLLRFHPIPMILSEIFCANLGGAATMCGDPPNIIIGTSLGYSFADFVTNTGVIVVFALGLTLIYFYVVFRRRLSTDTEIDISRLPKPEEAITNKKSFMVSSGIFAFAVILLVTHAQTGLTVAFIGLLIAALMLVTSGKEAFVFIRKVDYKTLLFFIGLFVVVGGLEQTGVLEVIAGFIGKISGGNNRLMIGIIIWGSAVASAFVDNIPFAATMIPVIRSLAATQGVDLSVLAWSLSMGTDIGGSATPIGASANVVGTAVAAKEGYPISWGEYCKYAVPATVLVILFSMTFIFCRYI